MSWDNKKDDWNLHVRTGPSIGKASENRMLDAMGGSDTIKKRLQTNADGSVTVPEALRPYMGGVEVLRPIEGGVFAH